MYISSLDMENYSEKRNKIVMDSSIGTSSSTPLSQVHDSIWMRSVLPQVHRLTEQDSCPEKDDEAKYSHFMFVQNQKLKSFWDQRINEIRNTLAFKRNNLPLLRVKKIMKLNEEVKMVKADTPIVIAKACEMFIMELTLRAWLQAEGCNRETLKHSDITKAVNFDQLLHFLFGVVNCQKDDEDENSCGETELHSDIQLPLRDINLNEIPEEEPLETMNNSSSSNVEFNYGSASQNDKNGKSCEVLPVNRLHTSKININEIPEEEPEDLMNEPAICTFNLNYEPAASKDIDMNEKGCDAIEAHPASKLRFPSININEIPAEEHEETRIKPAFVTVNLNEPYPSDERKW